MKREVYTGSLDRSISGRVIESAGVLSVAAAVVAGSILGAAPATAAGCPPSKSYEQTFSADELSAFMGESGPVEQVRDHFVSGVNNAGIRPGSEIVVGAGVNQNVTNVPYTILNERAQTTLSNVGYRTVHATRIAVDAVSAAKVRVDEKPAVECTGPNRV